jgi:hypothetical protein
MYVYFCVLQIILLANLNGSILVPASTEILLSSISGIINLSSFDKQFFSEKLKIPANLFQKNSLLSNLGGVALLFGVILLILILVLTLGKVLKSKKVQNIMIFLKNFFFWNFLIRYF